MAPSLKRKKIRAFLIVFWSVVVTWMFFQMQASGFDESVLESDSLVDVENTSEFIRFFPKASKAFDSSTIVVFYPGALVQAEAYTPFARKLAENGYPVIIQKIPFRLAFTKGMEKSVFDETLTLINSYPDTLNWVLAGHSKGGAMASEFAGIYPKKLSGLLLIGTSHPRRVDLSNLKIPVTKVHASEDGLASMEEVKEFSVNLPNQTNFVLVDGGNHSQFGYYGFQFGSGSATISREEQQQQLLNASLELLLNLN